MLLNYRDFHIVRPTFTRCSCDQLFTHSDAILKSQCIVVYPRKQARFKRRQCRVGTQYGKFIVINTFLLGSINQVHEHHNALFCTYSPNEFNFSIMLRYFVYYLELKKLSISPTSLFCCTLETFIYPGQTSMRCAKFKMASLLVKRSM